MSKILDSLGEMTRFANRIRNTHPELVSEMVSKQIDSAQELIHKNSDFKPSEIITHQVGNNGFCKEEKCSRLATKDYNGHGHWVCEPCYDSLTRYFEEEYD